MSMKIEYKKQILFFFLLFLIMIASIEISVRVFELFLSECGIINAETLPYNYFQKRLICYDFLNLVYEYNPVISLKPNQHLSTININDYGFRGNELENNEDIYRIVIVGGSTVFGTAVFDHESIPAELANDFDDFENVEIINAGIASITSNEEIFHIKNKINTIKPDLIIIYDGANDVHYKITNYSVPSSDSTTISFKDFQEYFRTPVVIYRNLISPLLSNFQTDDKKNNNAPGKIMESYKENFQLSDKVSEKWYQNMKDFCDFSNKNNIKSVVIIQPTIYHGKKILTNYETGFYLDDIFTKTTFTKMREKLGQLPECTLKVDLSDVFENVEIGIYRDGVHLNNQGNKLIANKIYENISPIVSNDIKKNRMISILD